MGGIGNDTARVIKMVIKVGESHLNDKCDELFPLVCS